jgi:hypothetical protein
MVMFMMFAGDPTRDRFGAFVGASDVALIGCEYSGWTRRKCETPRVDFKSL